MTAHSASRSSSPPSSQARGVTSFIAGRVSGLPAWVVLTQLFIGLGWLRAAIEKVIEPAWWRNEVIASFLAARDGQTLRWYEPFVDLVVSPYAIVFAVLVVLAQFAAGASLVTGRFIGAGLGMRRLLHVTAIGAATVRSAELADRVDVAPGRRH